MKKTLAVSVIAVMSLSCGQGKYGRSAKVSESSIIIDAGAYAKLKGQEKKNQKD